MNLIELIETIPVRENSGAVSSNRFDFQKNWAICKLLELYKKEDDFVLAFEFHDDILILNSSENPTKASFYQIKTSSKNWTLNDLLKTEQNSNSILGKLLLNKFKFNEFVDVLYFVSNNGYNIDKQNKNFKGIDNIQLKKLSNKVLTDIKTSIKKEFKQETLPNFENYTYLNIAELPVKQQIEITQNILSDFIESSFPNLYIKPKEIYDFIFGEIKRKNNYENKVQTFKEVIEKKSISKNDFDKMIQVVISNSMNRFENLRDKIEERLNSEKFSINFTLNFKKHFRDYEIDRMDKNNDLLNRVVHIIDEIVKRYRNEEYEHNLKECLDFIFQKFTLNFNINNLYKTDYIKTIILTKLYEE